MPPNQPQPSSSSSFLSTTVTTITNHFKPHKAEAIHRIRTNALCLVTTFIVSYLLPGTVPSLPSALSTLFADNRYQAWTTEWVWEWACILETGLIALFAYNILEAIYAIKYPRAPLPHITSPAKAKTNVPPTTSTPKRAFKILSPNSSPQPQKPFTFSPSSSLTSASIALHQSSTTPGPSTGKGTSTGKGPAPYAQSPLSTPSRVVHYTVPPSSSTTTMASSTSPSEYLATPSPVISAYRGKHAGVDVGRALDGSYLLRINPGEVDED
ncbi:hypothetical protein GALMADRAFT_70717 [Galerina marginata CBS 339.88]|uniref:Uncharacterized protein n=1 Tax=Galerina marginata (strain CBS 339.88) TaxID=685588 RepID=A0A067T5C1_GALM3|nr:hypothetical protein GALMADRAFT_70717 [Galerina marginata CBS 339.88]